MTDTVRSTVVSVIADAEALYQRLIRLLATLDGEHTVDLGRQGMWTKAQVAALWDKSKHLPGVRALFEATAAHPGEQVTFSEVVAHSGLDERQQGNEHARMSRLAAELFGGKRWPIENWQGPTNPATGKEEKIYRMREEIAVWWREIAG